MDSILLLFFSTGFTGFLGYFFPGFPEESLETPIASGDKQNQKLKFPKIQLFSQRSYLRACLY
jgi:hypothetical protein